jgi:hypothetical protein
MPTLDELLAFAGDALDGDGASGTAARGEAPR